MEIDDEAALLVVRAEQPSERVRRNSFNRDFIPSAAIHPAFRATYNIHLTMVMVMMMVEQIGVSPFAVFV